MNIEAGTVQKSKQIDTNKPAAANYFQQGKDFKSELENLKTEKKADVQESKSTNKHPVANIDEEQAPINDTKNLSSAIEQINSSINQTEDIERNELNNYDNKTDISNINQNKELNNQLLNNDMPLQNIQKEKPAELKTDINFAQNSNETFSSYFSSGILQESDDELQEDNSVISSMAENIAMVNKVLAQKASSTKTPNKTENIGDVINKNINASTLNMTRSDVQFFINLAQGNNFNINSIAKESESSGASLISETLANLMTDSLKTSKPFRINFDNDISVIIKLSKEGRISASFIPGSDIADNYLRNNLSNLVQRFNEENIPYDDILNQGQRRDREQEQNNKKDKKNE